MNKLQEICAVKRDEVARRRQDRSLDELERLVVEQSAPRGRREGSQARAQRRQRAQHRRDAQRLEDRARKEDLLRLGPLTLRQAHVIPAPILRVFYSRKMDG